jgi:hypothetical protein
MSDFNYAQMLRDTINRLQQEKEALQQRLAASEAECRDRTLAAHVLWDWISERYSVDSLPAWRTRWEWLGGTNA